MSSLAAYAPQADAAAYSASKAGITSYGQSLRELLAPFGVDVTLVHPGHVETGQTEIHQGNLPMLVSPQKAAQVIVTGISKGKSNISFPLRLRFLIWLGNLLPGRMRAACNRSFRFYVES